MKTKQIEIDMTQKGENMSCRSVILEPGTLQLIRWVAPAAAPFFATISSLMILAVTTRLPELALALGGNNT